MGGCNLVMSVAAVLDPRNKKQLIEHYFPKIYSTVDVIEHITIVCETLCILYEEYLDAHKANNIDKEIQGESQSQKESNSFIATGKEK